jgi:hypothetical protein
MNWLSKHEKVILNMCSRVTGSLVALAGVELVFFPHKNPNYMPTGNRSSQNERASVWWWKF